MDSAVPYPDGPPVTELEKIVDSLNRDMLLSEPYTAVDDVIVYCLFASKRRARSYRSWTASSSSGTSARNVTAKEGVAITELCHSEINSDNPTRESCRRATVMIQQSYGHLFHKDEISIIEQWV
jgi:hypothetical protein